MIKIENLSLSFGDKPVVKNINLSIADGEILGLVGESGCGKSVTALTLMGLESANEQVLTGRIMLDDTVLLEAGVKKNEKLYKSLQGDKMTMVFQEPMTSLNPTQRAGIQLDETLRLHTNLNKEERYKKIIEAFISVGLTDAERVYKSYPHELSGGMRQRVMIAMAIILRPDLLVADEPTTALDVTVQKQIVDLLKEININQKNSMLFITHDLNLAGMFCDRIAVMKDGEIVECGAPDVIFVNPRAEYTKKLISSVRNERKVPIDNLMAREKIVEVKDLSVFYKNGGNSLLKSGHHAAISGINFDIRKGECVGLVGESGCGKTTLAKALLGINKDVSGELNVRAAFPQLIFQDPYSSLNPAKTIGWQLEEPLRAMDRLDNSYRLTAEQRYKNVIEILKLVGLSEEYYYRKPSQLSGGQRQRVSIAQALITEPEFVIADEPVSALDVTIQAQVMALLKKLQNDLGISMLFISHDISVVASIADRIMVMKDGKLVEFGDASLICDNPKEEYTKTLMQSAVMPHC